MELDALVQQAQAASPMERINWRDPIAAHGTRAIAAVRPWLTDPALAAFAVRVIERVGADTDATEAVRVLRGVRSKVPPFVRTDVDWALRHLAVEGEPGLRSNGVSAPPVAQRSARREPAGANARTPRRQP